MKKKINIFVGGSTNSLISDTYYEAAMMLGKKINERRDYSVIFDGCEGLPSVTFKELENTMDTTIFITKYYRSSYFNSINTLIKEFNKQTDFINHISREADAMIFMKGGISTVAEIIHLIEAKKNGEHDKPIVILNINNEWSELVNLLNSYNLNDIFYVTNNVIDALNYIESDLFKST